MRRRGAAALRRCQWKGREVGSLATLAFVVLCSAPAPQRLSANQKITRRSIPLYIDATCSA